MKKSLFLDEFHNLNEDLEEEDVEKGFVTAAMGHPFQRRLLDSGNDEWQSSIPAPMGDGAGSKFIR